MVDAFVEPETSPRLTITPALQDFGDVVEGESSMAASFTVENVGDGDSAPLTATLGGTGAGAFAFTANNCAGEVLAPGATCTISIEFAPEATGRAMATVDVTDGDVRTSATLQGRGISGGALSIDPSPHNFGRAVVGTPTAAQTFTVTNNGGAETGTLMAALGGTDPMQFRITDDNCAGMTLAPAATCTIDVEYNPSIDGSHAASLAVTASPGDTVNAALLGMASAPPSLRVSPLTVGYGSAPTGTVSAAQTITVTNTGGMPTGALTNTLGGANASEFSITGSTCDGLTLAGGASCTINVVWTAGAAGDKVATLTVGDGTLSGVSNLSATAVTPGTILVEPMMQNFGDSPIGIGTGGTTFTARNPGGTETGILTVAIAGTNPGDFRIVSDGCSATTLAPSASCTVAVEFLPTATGNRSATLRVAGSPGGTGTSDLRGNGVAPALLEVTPTAHNFSSIATGASGTNFDFTVRNTGTSASGIPTVELTGVNSVHFSIVSNTCTAALAGGASCTVTVNYLPTALGSHTAVLNVTGLPGGNDTADLSGTGITPAALELVTAFSSATFGNTAETDQTTTQTIRVRNAGAATTGTLTVTPPSADFTIVTNGCTGTLAGSASCDITVRFNPAMGSIGLRRSSIGVSGTPGGVLSASVEGTGVRDIEATVSPSFNPTNIGANDPQVWTFRNNTTRSIVFGATPIAFATGDAAMFTATYTTGGGLTTPCASATVAANGTCQARIIFTPTGAGGTARGTNLTISGTGTGGVANTETYPLTAQTNGPLIVTAVVLGTPGTSAPTPGACPGSTASITPDVAFGTTQAIGLINQARICYYANGTAIMGGIRTTGTFAVPMGESQALAIVGDTCTGANLASGARCEVLVRWYPSSSTPRTGTVALSYGTAPSISTITSAVTGTGAAGANVTITPVAPATGDFGAVRATVASATQTFTIRNTGALATGAMSFALVAPTGGPADVSAQMAFTGSGAGDCSSFAAGLAAAGSMGDSCTVTVRWTPLITNALATAQGARIRARRTAAGVDTFQALTGTTTRAIEITTPATKTLAYGTVNQGVATAAQSFTITNFGAATSAPISCTVSGGAAGDWTVTNNCPPGGLASAGTCTCDLVLNATTNGNRGATFNVSAGGNATQQDTGSTTATANSPPILALTPNFASIDFGSVAIGANSSDISFTVRNQGSVSSPANVVPALTGAGAAQFEIRPGSTCGTPLASGATCTFSIRFSPTSGSGLVNASLTVDDGPAVQPTGSPAVSQPIQGTIVGATGNVLRITPSPVNFGQAQIGVGTAAQTFTLFNLSASTTANLTWFYTAPFPISTTGVTNPCTFGTSGMAAGTLAPSSSCNFQVRFVPTAAAFQSNLLTVTAGGFQSGVTSLFGTGVNAPTIGSFNSTGTSAIAALSFGAVPTGTSADLTYRIRNNAATPSDFTPAFTSAALSGPGAARYSVVSNTCTGATLAANDGANGSGADECVITLRYSPTSVGVAASTTFTVTFGSLTSAIALSGNGVLNAQLGLNVTTAQTCRTTATPALTTATCTGGTWVDYTVTNGGDVATSAPVSIAFTGRFSQFSTTCSTTLALGAMSACNIRVQYSPDDLVADTGTITVSAPVPGGTTSSVMQTINGTSASALSVSGTATFPNTAVTAVSAAQTFTFTYAAGATPATNTLSYTLTGTEFDVTSDNCSGTTLAAGGGSCTIQVRFRPEMAGAGRTGTLTVSDGRDFVSAAVTFTGTGT